MGKNLSFIFGAGISFPADMPKTDEITKKILTGEGFEHIGGSYIQAKSLNPDCYVKLITEFLGEIKELIESYNYKKKLNYEDLYLIISQIHDHITGEYFNPIVVPFIEKVRLAPTISYLEVQNYIIDVIFSLLSQLPNSLDHLDLLERAYYDKSIERVNVFTLNHDTLVEQYLKKVQIPYCDGFNVRNNDLIHFWEPNMFQGFDKGIKLLKIHGSINWYHCRHNDSYKDYFCKCEDRLRTGKYTLRRDPMILVGTFNKILEYERRVFDDLQFQFYQLIHQTDLMVVSGYCFGDKAVNSKIIHWMESSREHKVIVIDPSFEISIENSPAIKSGWYRWKEEKRAIEKSLGIEKISWCDIKKIFECGCRPGNL